MTSEERIMTVAYARMIEIGDLMHSIIRTGAFDRLSEDRKLDFINAEDALLRVKGELSSYVGEHTGMADKEA